MAKAGILQKIYVKVTNTHTIIGGEQTSQIDYTNNTLDVSDKDSAWDKFIGGTKSWQVQGTFIYDSSATGKQKEMLDALMSGDSVTIFIGELGAADAEAEGVYGDVIISSISEKKERNGVMTRDITFKGTGAPTPVNPA